MKIPTIKNKKLEVVDIDDNKDSQKVEINGLEITNEVSSDLKCPHCGFEAKNKLGLTSHIRLRHSDEYKNKKEVGE